MRRAALLAAALSGLVLAMAQACTSREVVGVVVGGLGIQPPTATVYVGDSVQLTATVQDDRGELLRNAEPDWASSAATVVEVSQSGVARGLRAGIADVTAEFGGRTANARIVVTPPPIFDFAVTETAGSTVVTEAGGTDQVGVVLLTQPSEDVVIEVTSDDPGEVGTSAELTFTPSNWNLIQSVTVVGVDDALIDGDQLTDLTVAVDPARSDAAFAASPAKRVEVLTRDDDSPGFSVAHRGGATSATEGGPSDTITVVLDAQPQTAVHLRVSVDDTTDAAVSPAMLTFTGDDWEEPQFVVFSAVDDPVADGMRSRSVSVTVAAGSDLAFTGLTPRVLAASTIDNESAGFTVAHTNGGTTATEGGSADSITVTLSTRPVSIVVLDFAVNDSTDASVSPGSLIFTSSGPATQVVTFAAVDDPDLDGSRPRTVTVSVNAASDAAFRSLPPQTIDATTLDNDVAGFTVAETGGVTAVSENGGTDNFTIVLSARPASDVTFQVASADLSEATVSPGVVTFTRSTWNQVRSVTVTGVDDAIGDGDQATQITVSVAPGSNAAFLGLPPQSLSVTTVDDDGVGFTLGETDGTVVNESGTLTDAIAVRLNAVPVANVVLAITADDPGEVSVSPTRLTFTPANGGQPQAVVVSGVDDLEADGDVVSILRVSVDPVLSLDPAYDTVSARLVSVTTLDDEVPNLIVTETGGGTAVEESGTTDAFTVMLSARPLSDVVVAVASDDAGEVTADSLTLTFTPGDWSAPKIVTVTGIDDGVPDGDQLTAVRLAVVDASSDDAWDLVADRTVWVTTTEVPAGFTVTESGGNTVVYESGQTDILTVVLEGPPTSDVVLVVSAADPSAVVADSTTLTFTPSSWSTPKTVTLTAVDDPVVDGPQVSTVTVSVAAGSDPLYVGLPPRLVSVTTTDDEVASFTVSETGGATTVDERGSTDAFTVVLQAQPRSDVVLTVSAADPGEVAVDSATLTFTPTTWSIARTVVVTGVADNVPDGDQLTAISIAVQDASSDDLWDALPNQSVVATTLDVTAGFTVTESGGATAVSEGGTSDSFQVVLDEQPAANVVFTVTSGDPGEVVADSATLTFTSANWSTAKTVTLTGVNDPAVDGPQISTVTLAIVPGSDPAFVGLAPRQVSVTTTDDDLAGFTVTQTGGATTVSESGTTDLFTVVLGAQPLSNVTLSVSSADAGEATVDSATLTFTPANWSTPKTVTVSGVDDEVADGTQSTSVTVGVAPGSDPAFTGLAAQVVTVQTTDDEIADFAITQTQGSTVVTEGGSTDTFQVVLLSQPSSNVTIVASSPNPGEVTVSPSSVTFRRQGNGRWDVPQTFTVTGVNDALADGDQITLVLVAVDDANSNDVFDAAPDKTVSVTTLDDEVPGFTVAESGGSTSVNENGGTDTFTLVLNVRPAGPVVLAVASGDPGEVAVDTPTVSFTTLDWSTPKPVTVRGVADDIADGPQLSDVTISVDPSSHPAYTGVAAQTVIVGTTDSD